jgi:roadblock/LC7 domain-containing protein
MSLISELAATPGVLAAGEYTYRGDRFSYEGDLDSETARMASIMCRATTMGVAMQTDIMSQFAQNCGCAPARGWVVRGQDYSVCVMANVFCFIDNKLSSINDIVKVMRDKLGDKPADLV